MLLTQLVVQAETGVGVCDGGSTAAARRAAMLAAGGFRPLGLLGFGAGIDELGLLVHFIPSMSDSGDASGIAEVLPPTPAIWRKSAEAVQKMRLEF
jgi:hypothetical protein